MKENTLPIFLACDDNYASLVAITIASICYSTDAHILFYVLDGGISEFHKKQIHSLRKKFSNFDINFVTIDTEKEFKKFNVDNHLSKDTYSRFLIPDLFPEINKALYLDVDIVVLDDITKLFTQDLHGHMLGAVPEMTIKNDDKRISKLCLDDNHQYFNAGVLLIDCEQWRKKGCTAKLLEMGEENPSLFFFLDQCMLNKFFNNKYQPLDYKCNALSWTFFYFKENNIQKYNELSQNIIIRHYETPYKPFITESFSNKGKIPNFEDFWFFAKMTPFYAGLKQSLLCSKLSSIQKKNKKLSIKRRVLRRLRRLIKKE